MIGRAKEIESCQRRGVRGEGEAHLRCCHFEDEGLGISCDVDKVVMVGSGELGAGVSVSVGLIANQSIDSIGCNSIHSRVY